MPEPRFPTVSVMVPCFEAAATLPQALASMAAQSRADWECVCVDDGSSDETWSVLQTFAEQDRRFRVYRFDSNRGRGAARQFLLEKVRGEFLAFLDADDWMFPDRLEQEVGVLANDDSLAAVGAPMVIFDHADRPIGIAPAQAGEAGARSAVFRKPLPPRLNFPASMIRTGVAKRAGFDPHFFRSQDSDMLIRALLGRRYAVLEAPVYAYRRAAMTLEKTLEGYRFRMRSHWRYVRRYPLTVGKTLVNTASKMALYKLAAVLGIEGRLMDQRYGEVDPSEARRYEDARAEVDRVRTELWPR